MKLAIRERDGGKRPPLPFRRVAIGGARGGKAVRCMCPADTLIAAS